MAKQYADKEIKEGKNKLEEVNSWSRQFKERRNKI